MKTALNPREEQRVAAPGVNDVAAINLGTRGRVTDVTGVLTGLDLPSLVANVAIFESFYDGRPYTLVHNDGRVFPLVLLDSFQPQGDRVLSDSKWGYIRPYSARFLHLTARSF